MPEIAAPFVIEPNVRLRTCVQVVAHRYGIPATELITDGPRGSRGHCRARQIVMWLGAKVSGLSAPAIGRMIQRDHTTVLFGVKKIERERTADEGFRQELQSLVMTARKQEAANSNHAPHGGWQETYLQTITALTRRRQRLKLSTETVAGKMGVSERQLARYESHECDAPMLVVFAWASALGLSIQLAEVETETAAGAASAL